MESDILINSHNVPLGWVVETAKNESIANHEEIMT